MLQEKKLQLWDLIPERPQQKAVNDGTETGFIAQNPYGMGYAAAIAGVRADLGLSVDTFIDTSYQWIDSNNIDNEEYSSYFYG